ncbi:hypothetical protein FRB99_000971 [Tulasnella sp. 403]|nr:hypothetical protein FRB99_000971 [Tulasnella sp. 403]
MIIPLFALFALAISWTRADDHLISQVQTLGLWTCFVDPQGNYNIMIIHTNDVHSHIDEFIVDGTDCVAGKQCFGGYARIKTMVDQLRQLHPDSLFINAGDEFQGTLFYTFLGPPIIADTLNQLGFDTMMLGNHEFDGGNAPLVKFIKSLNFPVISANVKTANGELESVTVPYRVFPKHNLAIIAATMVETPSLASPDAGTAFLDPTKTVQDMVDHILVTEKVKRIIVLTHTGYDIDIKIAQNTRNVHLIVGGHTHTLLGNFPDAAGPYPTIEKNLDSKEVFVVTAAKWGRYLGKIDVAYNSEGKIVAYTGAPIVMESTIPQNPQLQAQINGWRKSFAEMGNVVIGNTVGTLDITTCQEKECPVK